MKTEAELKEFYYDVIHQDHVRPLGEYLITSISTKIRDKYGVLVCMNKNGAWYISGVYYTWTGVYPWIEAEEYIYTYRTDLSDADRIALILKYS